MFLFDQFIKLLGRNTATVLVFHKVPLVADPLVPEDPDLSEFIAVLDMVMEHFKILPLGDVVTHHLAGTLPQNAACLTFDDGYADWAEGLVPVLLQRNAHATFFVTTAQFEGSPMWHERVIRSVRHAPSVKLDLTSLGFASYSVSSLTEKINLIARLQSELKYLPVKQRDSLIDGLESICTVAKSAVSLMSSSDLRALHSKGFAVGSHTANHPILSKATKAEVIEELGQSKEKIETLIGGTADSFAYPNGRPATDFNTDHVALVKSAGYRFAVTTDHGVIRQNTDRYLVPRFTPWGPGRFKMLSQTLRNQAT